MFLHHTGPGKIESGCQTAAATTEDMGGGSYAESAFKGNDNTAVDPDFCQLRPVAREMRSQLRVKRAAPCPPWDFELLQEQKGDNALGDAGA